LRAGDDLFILLQTTSRKEMTMWLQEVYQRLMNRPRTRRQPLPQTPRRSGIRLALEQLEDRTVPSNFNAATVSDLIADINAANQAGGSNTITLTAKAYHLTAADNTTDGATALPVISANDNLTILGNGATIQRGTGKSTPAFRLIDVAGGASLGLANLTLQGGLAFGSGRSAEGGAIYNQGILDLNGVTVQNNIARGQDGQPFGQSGQSAAGGGIYSGGSVTLEGGTKLQNNQAIGGNGGPGAYQLRLNGFQRPGGQGGNGFGGGVFVSSGSVNLTGVTISSNTAQGGAGGDYSSGWAAGISQGRGGYGLGGGIYASGGHVTLLQTSVTGNAAQGGTAGSYLTYHGVDGLGEGGGLYIDTLAAVSLDAFTLVNILHNTASTSDPNSYGSYTVTP
jgi:hypothetical protein